MGSSASQARGAAKSHAARVRSEKLALASAVVGRVYGMEFPDATPSRMAVIDALCEHSVMRLRQLAADVGFEGDEIALIVEGVIR